MSFLHSDTGTPESRWRRTIAERELPALDLAGVSRLVIVAAHPDDETLGAAGLLHTAAELCLPATVVVATDGEASHPASPTFAPQALARLRRAESLAAAGSLHPQARVEFLGLPDGGLEHRRHELEQHLVPLLDASALVVSPWRSDRHPDHTSAARAAADACAQTGARLLEYPIWLWHWGESDDVPWPLVVALPLDPAAARAKFGALGEHRSQVLPLSPAPGDEVLLHAGFLEHFTRPVELFIETGRGPAEEASAAHFDRLLEHDPDPWGVESRWYERRKRAVLLASLPAEHSASTLELGCSTGVLSRELALRGGALLGLDFSERAIRAARARNRDLPQVSFELARVPDAWPAGRFDLIVVSEMAYYLAPAALDEVIDRCAEAVTDDGAVVICHWRHALDDDPHPGDRVTARFRAHPLFDTVSLHEERDFVLAVLGRGPSRSVAEREGLVRG